MAAAAVCAPGGGLSVPASAPRSARVPAEKSALRRPPRARVGGTGSNAAVGSGAEIGADECRVWRGHGSVPQARSERVRSGLGLAGFGAGERGELIGVGKSGVGPPARRLTGGISSRASIAPIGIAGAERARCRPAEAGLARRRRRHGSIALPSVAAAARHACRIDAERLRRPSGAVPPRRARPAGSAPLGAARSQSTPARRGGMSVCRPRRRLALAASARRARRIAGEFGRSSATVGGR